MMMDWLAEQAAHNADGLALRFGSDCWRYEDLDAAASKMCACLAAAGVVGGTHVGVLLPNCPGYLVLVHALLRMAAVIVPLNTRLTTTELRWQIEHADVALLICNADTAAIARALECPWLELPGTQASAPARQIETHSNAQFLVFTSGTSGRPKAVQLTRSNILAGAQASAARLGLLEHDCWLLCMPLYHVGGLAAALRTLHLRHCDRSAGRVRREHGIQRDCRRAHHDCFACAYNAAAPAGCGIFSAAQPALRSPRRCRSASGAGATCSCAWLANLSNLWPDRNGSASGNRNTGRRACEAVQCGAAIRRNSGGGAGVRRAAAAG